MKYSKRTISDFQRILDFMKENSNAYEYLENFINISKDILNFDKCFIWIEALEQQHIFI